MADPLVVGLTGGIASGKSTVARLFADLGIPVIDADIVSREVVNPGQAGLLAVVATFGEAFLLQNGELDRKRLSRYVFSNPEQRKRLEGILHPLIRQRMLEQARGFPDAPYLLFVIPLLYETGQAELVDRILLVDCSEATQLARLMERDGLSEAQAQSIISTQASREQRLQIAEDILLNERETSLQQLRDGVLALHSRYLSQRMNENPQAALHHP